jgi:hypothetical protein
MTRRLPLCAIAVVASVATAWPAMAHSAQVPLKITAKVHMLAGGRSTLTQAGTFTGAPMGHGTVRVRTNVGSSRGSIITFVLSNSRGSLRGTSDCAVTFKGSQVHYRGTAKITGGTGAYRGMRSRRLRVSGHGDLADENFLVYLAGQLGS